MIEVREHYGARSADSEKRWSPSEVGLEVARERRLFSNARKHRNVPCFLLTRQPTGDYRLETNYYIGLDWINAERQTSIFVEPKLNHAGQQVDVLRMLLDCITDEATAPHIRSIYTIQWDAPKLTLPQEKDFLTPFLLVEFLGVLKTIVRKGLRKSYRRTRRTLRGRMKGKLHVTSTVRHHVTTGNQLGSVCSYDEFTVDTPENRLLKRALEFVQRHLPSMFPNGKVPDSVVQLYGYLRPAFERVGTDSNQTLRNFRPNPFFTEYEEGLRLAQLILSRFGYNIHSDARNQEIKFPPFWIDMSLLFELYVLRLLSHQFKLNSELKYQFQAKKQYLDYLLRRGDLRMVIDAKYKPIYQSNVSNKKGKTDKKDMRQISGYARLNKVRNWLNVPEDQLVDCLIIYPKREAEATDSFDELCKHPISGYTKIYKWGVSLPVR